MAVNRDDDSMRMPKCPLFADSVISKLTCLELDVTKGAFINDVTPI